MEIISSALGFWNTSTYIHNLWMRFTSTLDSRHFFCNWICSYYNHAKDFIFNKIMRAGRIYPSFLESALHTDEMMYILVWNCGGLAIRGLWNQKLTKLWRILALNLSQCALLCMYDGVHSYVFYLGTTESMAERNIFSARSRFGIQGNITKEMWSHVHMKRSRRLVH